MKSNKRRAYSLLCFLILNTKQIMSSISTNYVIVKYNYDEIVNLICIEMERKPVEIW